MIHDAPERLAEIRGLSAPVRERLVAGVRAEFAAHRLQGFLRGLGLGPRQAVAVVRHFGHDCEAVLRADPYLLAGAVPGIGFGIADRIAKSLGLAAGRAGARAGRDPPRAGRGRRCGPFVPAARGPPGRGARAARSGDDGGAPRARARGPGQRGGAGPRRRGARGRDGRVPAWLAASERGLARSVARLLAKGDSRAWTDPERLAAAERDTGIALAPRAARGRARSAGLPRGAPDRRPRGRQDDDRAPGGRPWPRRTARACAWPPPPGAPPSACPRPPGGRRATMHRLLGWDPERGGFEHDADDPLDCDLLVVDEISMLDVALAHHLFKAVQPADARGAGRRSRSAALGRAGQRARRPDRQRPGAALPPDAHLPPGARAA